MIRGSSLLVALAVAACASSASPDWQMPQGSPAPARAGEPVDPGEPPNGPGASVVFWRTNERAAWTEAEISGRGLLVDFYAEWCEECREASATWRDPSLRRAIATRFVPLRIDVTEISPEGREQLERYQVNKLPTTVAVSAEGTELFRFEVPPAPDAFIDLIAQSPAR